MNPAKVLFLALFALLDQADVSAVEVGAGVAVVDSMDNRAHPAASARVGWTEGTYSQAYYWGEDFGPVSERNTVLTLARKAPVKGLSLLFAHYGLALSEHKVGLYTNKESKDRTDAPAPTEESDYNLGGVLGMEVRTKTGPLTYSLSWDSHIFLTGSPFIIYLTSARKQTISFVLGVSL